MSAAKHFVRSSTPDLSRKVDDSSTLRNIPDIPENQEDRHFLKNAPKSDLHMPVGNEVKGIQCWRCKGYGHRTGDRECPMVSGNIVLDQQRLTKEDPMMSFVNKQLRRQEKYERVEQLMLIMEEIRKEEAERRARKKHRKDQKHNKRSHDREDNTESKRSKT